MPMPLPISSETLAPASALVLLAAGLLAGCSSPASRPDVADHYDPNGVSARAYGYVRPALDVRIRVRGSQDRGGRSTPVADLGPIGTDGGSGDLWDRVRARMALEQASNPRVDSRVRALQGQPEYLTRLSRRAQPYLHMIVREIEQRGMPMELALLPEIESSYNPRALSPKAASGMWQFIPATGVHMGLSQNDWYDGRNDIVASTRAALSYLESLRKDLGGDWILAIAAYNCGPERVRSAQQANRAKGKPTDYWSLDLPAETQAYVPQLLAVARVVAAPGRHGLTMPKVADRPALELVHARSQIDLNHAARLVGLDPGDLAGLNPGLKQGKTQPSGPHTLLVPAGAGQPLRLRLAGATPAPLARSAVAVADGDSYRVRKGEDLAAIARQLGVTSADLRAANGLKSNKVAAGTRLTVPRGVAGPAQVLDRDAGAGLVYVVKGGDTMASVARAHKVSRDDLAEWNGIARNEPLLPGQRLRVGAGDAPGPAGRSG
jgi:membrane-bound lytic murein transglycosylase D